VLPSGRPTCGDEGYSSSLATHTLRRLGLRNATELEGGYQAWRRAAGGGVSG